MAGNEDSVDPDEQLASSRKRRRSSSPESEPPENAEAANSADGPGGPSLAVKTGIFENDEEVEEAVVNEAEAGPAPAASELPGNEQVVVKTEMIGSDVPSRPLDVMGNRLKLMNFSIGGSIDIVQVKPSDRYKSSGGAAPPPKCPRKAHYMIHTVDEERQYVGENLVKHRPAIAADPEPDTDSEEEGKPMFSERENRRFRSSKMDIFTKYDFSRRAIDMTTLAAYQQKDQIIAAIENHRVVIIDGFTGCGKTTQVPQILIDRAYETKRPCNILVTQPRKLAALSVARRVCAERNWQIGSVVGHSVGMDKKFGQDTLVTFMTTGVLLNSLSNTKTLKKYTHIIVDEVHERDLETDLLLLFIKKILLDDISGKERHVKIILMSATLDSEKFSKYLLIESGDEFVQTPVIQIPSYRRFHVEEIFLNKIVDEEKELTEILASFEVEKAAISPEVYLQAVKVIVSLDTGRWGENEDFKDQRNGLPKQRGSVLVFLPGIAEIKTMERCLQEEMKKASAEAHGDVYKWIIVPLHSSVTSEEQGKVFAPQVPYARKIILSTNIAESSITVPDIVYVIDFCLTKSSCVDTRTNFNSLRTTWASISQCIQRKGRTGRVANGYVFRMIPVEFFRGLDQNSLPEMQISSLENVILRVKKFNMGSPRELLCLALDPPSISGIERAVANLKEVGALTTYVKVEYFDEFGQKFEDEVYDTCDGNITFMGEVMSSLPISPQCTRLILIGHCLGVMEEAIIIAAGLSGKSPFAQPYNHQQQMTAYLKKLHWAKTTYSDCFAILHAYKEYQKQCLTSFQGQGYARRERQWGRTFCVQVNQMREMQNLIEDIDDRLKQNNYIQVSHSISRASSMSSETSSEISKETALMLKIAIAGAFYPNYFHRHRPDQAFEREREKEVAGNDLFSTVYYRNFPSHHNAPLYSMHIVNALSYELSVPRVKCDGQKTFAVFDNSGRKIGPICESVYRAIKKRQIREQLSFNALNRDDERVELERQNQERNNRQFLRCPEQVELPGVDIESVEICVTHQESPSQFWAIRSTRKESLQKMDDDINACLARDPRPRNLTRNEVFVGALVVAPFRVSKDEPPVYYRARIDASRQDKREHLVYFIDYGNSAWLDIREIRQFPEELKQFHYHTLKALAVECRLSEVRPSVLHGSVWTEEALMKFNELIRNLRPIDFRIYAINCSVLIGELCLRTKTGPFNFNKYLVDNNFADKVRESYVVEVRHLTRTRYGEMLNDPEQIHGCNKQQIAPACDRDFYDPPRGGNINYTLRGPYSPLELDFQSLCYSTSSKAVTIDSFSVNSVILDTEPTAPTSRLIVSATLNIQDVSQRVVARDTTIMPATPGMMALMSLMFTPKAELRSNIGKTRYTGVVCGLGTDPEGHPIYLDHDLEIVFDTDIDDEDIDLINDIRHNMNVILREHTGSNPASSHEDLRRKLFMLLKKQRKRLDEEIWPQESYVWEKVRKNEIVHPNPRRYPRMPGDVFKPHCKIRLHAEAADAFKWDYAV